MSRLLIRHAIHFLRLAERFSTPEDKDAICAFVPLLSYLLLPPAERSRRMRRS